VLQEQEEIEGGLRCDERSHSHLPTRDTETRIEELVLIQFSMITDIMMTSLCRGRFFLFCFFTLCIFILAVSICQDVVSMRCLEDFGYLATQQQLKTNKMPTSAAVSILHQTDVDIRR